MANVDKLLQQAGGFDFARANLFEVRIGGIGNDDSIMLAKAASMPTATVNPIEVPYMNRKWKIPGDRIFADWTVTFLNDGSYDLRNALLSWQKEIQGFENFTGDTFPGQTTVHKRLEVWAKDRELDDTEGWVFSCWPTEIGSIELSWDSADTVQEYTVTFAVSWDAPTNTSI
jgi:hypothetical protein